MDKGDATLNVPTYNGGLFNTTVGQAASLPLLESGQAGSLPHETRDQRGE